MFFLKDVIATNALLATEPGITARAKHYYGIALLPGPLFVNDAAPALVANLIFGALVGLMLYVSLALKRGWLLVLPSAIFLCKDLIAMTVVILSTGSRITPQARQYYSIAMLPGSLLHRVGPPTLFNVAFGLLLGLLLYLYVTRRKGVVPN